MPIFWDSNSVLANEYWAPDDCDTMWMKFDENKFVYIAPEDVPACTHSNVYVERDDWEWVMRFAKRKYNISLYEDSSHPNSDSSDEEGVAESEDAEDVDSDPETASQKNTA